MWTARGAGPPCGDSAGSGDPTARTSISAPAPSILRRRWPEGPRFVVLEFTTPRFAPLRALYQFYFRRVLPAIGRAVSKHRDAYSYLPESVNDFPDPDALAGRLARAGFSAVGYELLSGGICAVHHGTR